MAIKSGSIEYILDQTAELLSFPFISETGDGVPRFTPTSLNEALGGSIGGNPISSSLIGSIIGEGEACTFQDGFGWVGNLQEINPDEAYWIKPSNSYGTTFDETATISGLIRNPSEKYQVGNNMNLISYPFAENKAWEDAVNEIDGTGNSLQEMGIDKITGNGVAKTHSIAAGWVGSLNTFTTGSGYWYRFANGGSYQLWKVPTGSSAHQEKYYECVPKGVNEHGAVAKYCGKVADATTGYHTIAEPPYSESAHTFGHGQTMNQSFIYWSKVIGKGPDGSYTSSLFDSASNDMSGSNDGTSDFIVGFFNTSSADWPYPVCCGATAWHDHQYASRFGSNHGGEFVQFCLMADGGEPTYTQRNYPNQGDDLVVKIYDPRRDLVVTGSVHKVHMNQTSSSIGDKVNFTFPTLNQVHVYRTGSGTGYEGNWDRGYCIKMDS